MYYLSSQYISSLEFEMVIDKLALDLILRGVNSELANQYNVLSSKRKAHSLFVPQQLLPPLTIIHLQGLRRLGFSGYAVFTLLLVRPSSKRGPKTQFSWPKTGWCCQTP
jgi:hypothetical protein